MDAKEAGVSALSVIKSYNPLVNLYKALPLLLAFALAGPAAHAADPVVAAAGDIACDPQDTFYNGGLGTVTACRQNATSDLAVEGGFDAVMLLGDNQYLDGALYKYQTVFGPTWGRLGPLLRPAPGNHEYETPGAAGYYDYFGTAAGKRTEGWYSYELGTWHVVVLNSNCAAIGGCGPGSPQIRWLEADLLAHPRACTLAYWHHPRFSSGLHNNDPLSDTFWRRLYAAGADLILVGHDHDYERFAPQDPDAHADPAHGIRELVVGTGGREVRPFTTLRANSEVRNAQDLGILKLRLRTDGYDWQFLPVRGATFTDAGSDGCHNAPDNSPDARALFLRQGRFRAEATWRDAAGNTGTGHLAAPAADGSGLFWFFGADNWELMVKVLDGCALNDHYWVYAAGTTDVEYTLTVTDTLTGRTVRYENPLGRTSPAVTDTQAFATCP